MLKAHPERFQAIWAYFLSTKTTEHANPSPSSPLTSPPRPPSPVLISFPPFSSPFLHTAEKGLEHSGFTQRATSLEFLFRLNRLVWGKFERTHSQPGDIQYDKKAGSYLIASCINTQRERRIAYAGWRNRNKKSCILHLIWQLCVIISLQFFYSTAQTEAYKCTHAPSFSPALFSLSHSENFQK